MGRIAAIVPTRNRPQSLARCLDALERQERMPELEIVVVDDGSADAAAVGAAVARCPRARLVRRARAEGPAAARNRGARATRAEILLFTDDDCEPAPEWSARMAAAIDDGADAVAGITVNGRPDDPIASASETVIAYVQERARGQGATTQFAASNNLGVAAHVFADVAFDTAYRYGEDRDWCARVVAAGFTLKVEPDAVVAHNQDLTLATFVRQQFGYGRGAYRFHSRHQEAGGLEAPTFYARLLGRGFEQGVVRGALVGVAQAATAAGYAREALRLEQRRSA